MVKNCGITSKEFTAFCIRNLKNELSDPIFEDELLKLHTAITTYTPKAYRTELFEQIFNFLEALLLSLPETPENANRKVIIREKMIDFCHTPKHAEVLHSWYHGKHAPYEKEVLNNTLRWKIVLRVFSRSELSKAQKWELFEDMKSRDSSDTMINKKITCQTLTASEEELRTAYANFFKKEEGTSLNNFVHQVRGFNHEIHEEVIRREYYEKFFKDVGRMLKGDLTEGEKWFAAGDYLEAFLTHFDPIIEGTAG
jgi:hypothetical protein